jgi:hypothetical protein
MDYLYCLVPLFGDGGGGGGIGESIALRFHSFVIFSFYNKCLVFIVAMNDNAPAPTLTEPGVRYFLSKSLEQCHKLKDYYHTQTFNFMVGIGFFLCLGIFLYLRYKGKPTPEEVEAKKRQQQEYILSKLKMVNATHYAQSKGIPMDCRIHPAGNGMGMLTNLPMWKTPDEDYWKRDYA